MKTLVFAAAVALLLVGVLAACNEESNEEAAWQQPVKRLGTLENAPAGGDSKFVKAQGPVGTYGELRIGMAKNEIASHLPAGVRIEDFTGPVHYKSSVIEKYLITVPASKLPILNTCRLLSRVGITFQLGFVDEKLSGIVLAVPAEHNGQRHLSEIIPALRGYFNTNAGVLPKGDKPDPLAKEDLMWAIAGTDRCNVEAGMASEKSALPGAFVIRIQSDKYLTYKDGKPGNDITASPQEAEYNKAYNGTIRGFEALRFGMREKEAMKNLPWGIAPGEIKESWTADDMSIKLVYGTGIPARQWELISADMVDDSYAITFMLGFTSDGLGLVAITVPSLDDEPTMTALKSYLRGKYGKGMYYSYDEAGYTENWVIARKNGAVELILPVDIWDDDAWLLVGTNEAMQAYFDTYYSYGDTGEDSKRV